MKKLNHLLSNLLIILFLSCPNTSKLEGEKDLKLLWKVPTILVDTPNSELLIIENETLVFSGEEELLTTISTENGSLIWKSDRYDGRALRTDHLLYSEEQKRIYGRHFNNIMVWQASDGKIIYELSDSLNGISASRVNFNTLTDGGFAMVGEFNDAHVFSWIGERQFKIDVNFATNSVQYNNNYLFIGQRNTVNGGLTQGRIRAFDATTGDSLWTYQTDNGGFYTRLYVQDGVVYGGARGNSLLGELVALNSETGEKYWDYNVKDQAQTQNLAISGTKLYANTGGGITALDLESGHQAWRIDWMGFDNNKPVYLEGYVYHIRDFELLVINDDIGEVVHREPVPKGERFYWHIAVGSDKIFTQTDASIIAYEPWHLRGE